MPADTQPRPHWSARMLEILWLTAAVAIPLAVNPWGASAFELPKAVLLRALVLLMALAALVLAAEAPAERRDRTPIVRPALAFGLVAAAFSVSPRTSLRGARWRQPGDPHLLSPYRRAPPYPGPAQAPGTVLLLEHGAARSRYERLFRAMGSR